MSQFTHLLSNMKQIKSLIRNLLPRRFQVYCVGCAKTGSTSLASMFSLSYRTAHEAKTQKTNQLIIDWLEKKIDKAELQRRLIERDRQLKLELESAHPLGYISDILVETFPNAKFIITIREPHSWLKSRLNFHYKTDPPAWRLYRDYFWKQRHRGYANEEQILMKFNLFSLDTYLSQYADHYNRVLNQIPKERFLLIKTSELNSSLLTISQFLGIKENKIRIAHSKQSLEKIEPLEQIEPEFVKAKIWYHCHEIITQYFPEKIVSYQ